MTGPVVLLTTNLARGGAETQVALLALSLSRRGWPVSVVSLLEPSAFQAELTAAGVQLHSLGMQPGRPDPLAVARLAAILRKERPRVLHSHMFHANPDDETGELRWRALGLVGGVVLLLVAHAVREEDQDEVIRLISARRVTRKERIRYEQTRAQDVG